MATFHERAQSYADLHYKARNSHNDLYKAYMQACADEFRILTEWRDPKEDAPRENEWVMLKMRDNYLVRYEIALFFMGQYSKSGRIIPTDEFVGWRPIEE